MFLRHVLIAAPILVYTDVYVVNALRGNLISKISAQKYTAIVIVVCSLEEWVDLKWSTSGYRSMCIFLLLHSYNIKEIRVLKHLSFYMPTLHF